MHLKSSYRVLLFCAMIFVAVTPLFAQDTADTIETTAGEEQPTDTFGQNGDEDISGADTTDGDDDTVFEADETALNDEGDQSSVAEHDIIEATNIEVVPDSTQTGYFLLYDLPDDNPEAMYEVIFKITEDDGETYEFPTDVSGDIGRGVIPGERKRIYWKIRPDIGEAVTDNTEITLEARLLSDNEIGTVTLQGNPPEAVIFINGKRFGAAPIENKSLPAGTYMLSVSLDGYEEYRNFITVKSGNNTRERYRLRSLAGSITVEGFPDSSEVFLNDELLGKTPIVDMEIPGGINAVVIKGNGNEEHETTVDISGAGDTIHSYRIIPFKKKMTVTPKPSRILKKQALKKSLLIPGRGQRYLGNRKKGNIMTALQIATLGGYIAAYVKASGAKDDYDDARAAYKKAETPTDIQAAWERVKSKHNTADSASGLARLALSGTAAVYLWNVVDVLFISKYREETPQKHSLRLSPFMEGDSHGVSASMRF